MSVKNQQCSITVAVSAEDHDFFTEAARGLDISCNVLMRRLVRYFLDGKISWEELFKQSSELKFSGEPGEPGGAKKKQIRAYLEPEQYAAFSRLAEEWGSTTFVVLRRLIQLYIAEKIERGNIWQ